MDGFTGNVVLKASETLAESLMHLIKEELMRTPAAQARARCCRGAPSPRSSGASTPPSTAARRSWA